MAVKESERERERGAWTVFMVSVTEVELAAVRAVLQQSVASQLRLPQTVLG